MTRRLLLFVFIISLGMMVAAADVLQAQGRGGRGGGGRGGWGGAGRGGAGAGWGGAGRGAGRGGNNTPGRGGRGRGQGEDGPDGSSGWIEWTDGTVEDGAKAEATDGETESAPSSGGNPMAGFGSRRGKERDTDGKVVRQVEDAIDAQVKTIIVIFVYQASAEAKDQRATEACKKFEDTVLADDKVAGLINKGVAIRVHTDDVDRDVKKLYSLRSSVPQIVILDPTGKKLWAGSAPAVDKLVRYLEAAHEKVKKEFGVDEDEDEDDDDDEDEDEDDSDDEPSSNDDDEDDD